MFNPFKFRRNRAAAGRGTSSIRAFTAAEVSRTLAPWVWDGGFSNAEVGANLSPIRARSRDMAKNSEQYVRWLGLFVSNVVGTGFTLNATPCQRLGQPDISEDAKKFLQYNWWKWSTNPRMVDLTGRKTFRAVCALVAENWARDGEAIVRIERGTNDFGLTLRVIRPDCLDETMNGAGTSPDTVIRNGVEVNRKTLRPVAYYFRANREDPMCVWVFDRPVVRVPADEILHVFSQHDETQTRGIPLGHAVLKKLKMLDEFNIAELVAARDESNTTGIFKAPAGREEEIAALNEDDDASAYLCQKSEPGTKYVLPQGWDYEAKTPQHPNREVAAFKNSMLRDVASGLCIEYACFANDWAGVSFSSVRVGTLAERDHWRQLQEQFIEQFVAPVYRAWLEEFLKTRLANPYVPSDFARLCDFEFRGRRWEWVDPMNDVTAAVTAVQNGWKTDEQIAADYGGDIMENLAVYAKVKDKRKELGLGEPIVMGATFIPDDDKDGDESGDKPDSKKPSAAKPTDKKPTEEKPDNPSNSANAAADGDLQATALNGAQVTAIVDIVNQAAEGKIPTAAVMPILQAAFPMVEQSILQAIVDSLTGFTPKAEGGDKPDEGGGATDEGDPAAGESAGEKSDEGETDDGKKSAHLPKARKVKTPKGRK